MLRRRLWLLAAAGCVLLLLALAARQLPALLERAAVAQLGELGIPLALRVQALDLGQLRIADVRAGGAPDLELRSAALHYRIADLVRGRAEALRLDGLVLRGRADAAGLSFGDLDALLFAEGSMGMRPPLLPRRVELRDLRLVLEHASGRAELRADASLQLGPSGIETLELEGRGADTAGGLDATLGLRLGSDGALRGDLGFRATAAGLAVLGLEAPPAEVAIGAKLEGHAPILTRIFEWDGRVADLGALNGGGRLDLSLSGLPLRPDLGAADARAGLRIEASRTPSGETVVSLQLPECGVIRIAPASQAVPPLELCLRTPDRELPSLQLGSATAALSGALRIESFALDWRLPEIGRVRGQSPAIELRPSGTTSALRVHALASGGRVALLQPALELEGLALELDADLSGPAPEASGRLALQQLRPLGADGAFLPVSLSGTLELSAASQRFAGELQGADAALRIGLVATRTLEPERSALSVRLHPLSLGTKLPLARLVPQLRPHLLGDGSGTLSGQVDVTLANGAPEATLRAELHELSLASREHGRIEKLTGVLELARLWPPEASAPQELHADVLDPGVPLEDVALRFHPHPGGEIEASVRAARFLGGTLELSGRATAGSGGIDVRGRGLDLGALLQRLDVEGLEAVGRADVTLPLSLEDGRVALRGGTLRAVPGGRLRYRSAAAATALGLAGESAREVVEALQNFEYEKLEADLDGDLELIHTRLRLHGREAGREGAPPIQLQLELRTAIGELSRALGLDRWLQDATRAEGPSVVAPPGPR